MSVKVLQGDCRQMLETLAPMSVHCVITSPPYFGLRAYGTDEQIWGGDPDCSHEWNTERYYREGGNSVGSGLAFSEPGEANAQRLKDTRWRENTLCVACGAWRGELGGEPTPQVYVEHIVEVFRAVRRVLRDDGTVWLNLGDSYATGAGKVGDRPGGGAQGDKWAGYRGAHEASPKQGAIPIGQMTQANRMPLPGLKPKDLIGIPWRVAFALQDDGWYLRSDIIWSKPNPMPESVTDRPTRAHEYLFLLSKSKRYYYDAAAIREPAKGPYTKMPDGWDTSEGAHGSFHRNGREKGARVVYQRGHGRRHDGFNDRWDGMSKDEQQALGANKRSVWTIATQPYPDAHFATFPERLVEPCVLAGTSERGCCPLCLAPWKRLANVEYENPGNRSTNGPRSIENRDDTAGFKQRLERKVTTTGWEASCGCGAGETIPCVVLDPFAGSGTVLAVALNRGRQALGIELQATYIALIHKRLRTLTLPLPMVGEVPA